jgi:hypothetical protein
MATTLRQVIEALDTYIESVNGLGITCIKGYPDFRQPTITTPLAALFYAGSNANTEAVRKRLGGSVEAVPMTLGVYASDEVNLFSLAEKLQSMRRRSPLALAIGSDQAQVYVGADERTPPDDEAPKEARHITTATLILAYEV